MNKSKAHRANPLDRHGDSDMSPSERAAVDQAHRQFREPTATPKPRAGEHTPDTDAAQAGCGPLDWPGKYGYMSEFARELEAERDLLRERERELVEALEKILRAEFGNDYLKDAEVLAKGSYWASAAALLAKHGR